MQKLDARRARLDRTIALQKIFQSIILLNDSIDETKDSLEMNQGTNMIEGICSDQESTDHHESDKPGRSRLYLQMSMDRHYLSMDLVLGTLTENFDLGVGTNLVHAINKGA